MNTIVIIAGSIFLIPIVVAFSWGIYQWYLGTKENKPTESKPIDCEEHPLDIMFLAIVDQIKAAKNDSDLYACYESIIRFKYEACEEIWLVSSLEDMFNKQVENIWELVVKENLG